MRVIIAVNNMDFGLTLSDAIKNAGHEVIGPVGSSVEIFENCQKLRPPLAIIDFSFEQRGLSIAEELCEKLDIYTLLTDSENKFGQDIDPGFDFLSNNSCYAAVKKIQDFHLNTHW